MAKQSWAGSPLSARVALVTGAGTGLGRACALALAEAGADIVALYRTRLDGLIDAVEALGRGCTAVQVDLARCTATELTRLVAQLAERHGRLDILINNAGTTRRVLARDMSEPDWDEVVHLNLRVPFFLAQAAAGPMLRASSGKIINVASMLSFQGGYGVASYAASKSGLAGLTRALANEWAPHGINVNAIAPGYMETSLTAPLRADPQRSGAILERIPAGRWGTPDDIKGAVVYLASPAADYVHGVVLPVDGGWLSR